MPETLQTDIAPIANDMLRLRKATVGTDNQADKLVTLATLFTSAIATGSAEPGLPTGYFAQTFPRTGAGTVSQTASASATEQVAAIQLIKGQVVTNIAFLSGVTAGGTLVNQWFTLRSSARVLLGVTADDTSTAWAADTLKPLALATPYTILTSGLYYLGCMVKATTVPTLVGTAYSRAAIAALPPILCGTDGTNTSLTNPASAPATSAAYTAGTAYAYAVVS